MKTHERNALIEKNELLGIDHGMGKVSPRQFMILPDAVQLGLFDKKGKGCIELGLAWRSRKSRFVKGANSLLRLGKLLAKEPFRPTSRLIDDQRIVH